MQLEDNKQSITSLPNDAAIAIHQQIRTNRMTVGLGTRQTKEKIAKQKKDTAAGRVVKQDPEKIRELLRLLGEDV